MSMTYWLIDGIGLNGNDIMPHIDKEKAAKFFVRMHHDDSELQGMIANNNYTDFDIEDFYWSHGYGSLAEALCSCDETGVLVWAGDGDRNTYLYYPKSMPWERTDNDPCSEDEAVQRIVNAVQELTDMTFEEINNLIDRELYVVGGC